MISCNTQLIDKLYTYSLLLQSLGLDSVLIERLVLEESCNDKKQQQLKDGLVKLFEYMPKKLFSDQALVSKLETMKQDFDDVKESMSKIYCIQTILYKAFGPFYSVFLQEDSKGSIEEISPVVAGKKRKQSKKTKKSNKSKKGGANTPSGELQISNRDQAQGLMVDTPLQNTARILANTQQGLVDSSSGVALGAISAMPEGVEKQLMIIGENTLAKRAEKITPEMVDEFAGLISNFTIEGTEQNMLLDELLSNLKQQLIENNIKDIISKKTSHDKKRITERNYKLAMFGLQLATVTTAGYLLYNEMFGKNEETCDPDTARFGRLSCAAYNVWEGTKQFGKDAITSTMLPLLKMGATIIGARAANDALFELPKLGKSRSELNQAFDAVFDQHHKIVDKNIKQVETIIRMGLKNISRNQAEIIPKLLVSLPGKDVKEKVVYLINEAIDAPRNILNTMGLLVDPSDRTILEQKTIELITKLNDSESTEMVLLFNRAIQQSKADIGLLQSSVSKGMSAATSAAKAAVVLGKKSKKGKKDKGKNGKKSHKK